ncbi:uncharacterized protein LOC118609352 [Rousettus aegyptiacus]|uniref:uncharacterized protein LOC118609352 n=1 Tax=Rousettus aegyptiacus TaxID=9407 RepID=UPI00168D7B69|nr:uncharacterized protein LOC118609352 [Rousettus aegyptiacus]XP_036084425.1 uncharacterized protein LOC118609352 [Rousettus aegyptiacus]
MVKVNDTRLLDQPAMGRGDKREERRFNYTGSEIGLPICFSKSRSATGCLMVCNATLLRDDWEGRPLFFRFNYPRGKQVDLPPPSPQSFPPCGEEGLSSGSIHRRRCYVPAPTRYNVSGTDWYILDWSGGERGHIGGHGPRTSWTVGLWWTDTEFLQTYVWKLGTAMGELRPAGWIPWIVDTKITACVAPPHVLMISGINVTMRGGNFYVTCYDCILTNCISFVPEGTTIMVFRQPSFVMLPVNVSGPWYADRGLQVLEEKSRQKRVIGLIIAGITALVSLIATAATAAIALSQTVQIVHYVNNLSKNVTVALGTQENIDNKLEQKLDALYSLVMYLGDEIQGLKVRFHLECHAAYQ